MSSTGLTDPDALLVRARPQDLGGRYESFFLRANDPTARRALWVRYTLLLPKGRPSEMVGDLWAVWFDFDGPARQDEASRIVAVRERFPISAADLGFSTCRVSAGPGELGPDRATGVARANGHEIAWDLHFDALAPTHRPFPYRWLERAPLPRTKTLTPIPRAAMRGQLRVDGAEIAIGGDVAWPGMMGHNWGSTHTPRYVWWQSSFVEGEPDAWFEGMTAELPIGPVVTPPLSLAHVHARGRTYAFDRLWRMHAAETTFTPFRFTARFTGPTHRLDACIEAPAETVAGLTYPNPDGTRLVCLNSKLARAELTLTALDGTGVLVLRSPYHAALEVIRGQDALGRPVRV